MKFNKYNVAFIIIVAIGAMGINAFLLFTKFGDYEPPNEVIQSNNQLLTALKNGNETMFDELIEESKKNEINIDSLINLNEAKECYDIRIFNSYIDTSGDYDTNLETVYYRFTGELLCNSKKQRIEIKYNKNYRILEIQKRV